MNKIILAILTITILGCQDDPIIDPQKNQIVVCSNTETMETFTYNTRHRIDVYKTADITIFTVIDNTGKTRRLSSDMLDTVLKCSVDTFNITITPAN